MRNTELFDRVADAIEQDPAHYNQTVYEAKMCTEDGHPFIVDDPDDESAEFLESCGTARCIAGWAVFLEGENRNLDPEFDYGHVAQRLLGLSYTESLVLFHYKWSPHAGLSVPDALRKLGGGAEVGDVTLGATLTMESTGW